MQLFRIASSDSVHKGVYALFTAKYTYTLCWDQASNRMTGKAQASFCHLCLSVSGCFGPLMPMFDFYHPLGCVWNIIFCAFSFCNPHDKLLSGFASLPQYPVFPLQCLLWSHRPDFLASTLPLPNIFYSLVSTLCLSKHALQMVSTNKKLLLWF